MDAVTLEINLSDSNKSACSLSFKIKTAHYCTFLLSMPKPWTIDRLNKDHFYDMQLNVKASTVNFAEAEIVNLEQHYV